MRCVPAFCEISLRQITCNVQVVKDIHPSFLQDLDVIQKRALICQELEGIQKEARRNARVLLGLFSCLRRP